MPPSDQPAHSRPRLPSLPSLWTQALRQALSQPLSTGELDEAHLVEFLDDEIALLRVIARRLLAAYPPDATQDQALKYLDAQGKMAFRFSCLTSTSHKLQSAIDPVMDKLLKLVKSEI